MPEPFKGGAPAVDTGNDSRHGLLPVVNGPVSNIGNNDGFRMTEDLPLTTSVSGVVASPASGLETLSVFAASAGDPAIRSLPRPTIGSDPLLGANQSSSATERLHYLEALVGASNAISSTLDPVRVAEILAARAAELLNVPAVAVLQMDAQGSGEIKIAASTGLSTAYLQDLSGPLDESIAGRVLSDQRTFASWDARESSDPRVAAAAVREGIVSVACAPMLFGGKPVGALAVCCHEERAFTPDQFHVLSLLAAQGAVALSNAQAYRELRAQASEVRAGFQRVGAALSASLDIGETLRLIVQLAVEMIGADGGAMFMLQSEGEGGGMRLAGMRGIDRRSVRRFRNTPISPLVRRVLDGKKVVIVPDTRRLTDTAFPTLRLNMEETADVRSVVCVPVMIGDRPLGVLEQYCSTPGGFSRADIQLLSSFAHQASVAIENARLYAQERSIAQTLQRAFLPIVPSNLSGFQIGRIYAPGSEVAAVGGDTYDLFTLPDGRIAALMADVSGQGTHAATLAVMAKYTIRAYAVENAEPSSVLRRANEAFLHQTGDSTFLTLCYALLDPVARTIQIASAAHPPALLWRALTGEVEPVGGAPGLIAGIFPDQDYPSAEVTLQSGDVLVFYTDGVVEARRRKVMFSTDGRLEATIAGSAHLDAQEIAGNVYTAVLDYVDGERTDDIALLVLKAE